MHEHSGHEQHLEKGPTATDPVCGMTVQRTTPHRYTSGGKDVFFCSARCRDRFVADPAKYEGAVQKTTEPSAKALEGEAYTCPMHPEVRSDKPGSCPKCGMALEPVVPRPTAPGG